MQMHIRKATINDAVLIQQLAHTIWPHTYNQILSAAQLNYMLQKIYAVEVLQYEMEHKTADYFIAYNDTDETIGFACLGNIEATTIKLHKIYLLPATQGKGLGKQLLKYCISTAQQQGYTSMVLNVNRHNNALNFYKAVGFIIIDEVDIDIGEGYFMNDYVMQYSW
jgi:diamine N-acetyltransferase